MRKSSANGAEFLVEIYQGGGFRPPEVQNLCNWERLNLTGDQHVQVTLGKVFSFPLALAHAAGVNSLI